MTAASPPKPSNTDWHSVAQTKLTKVLGSGPGEDLMREVLATMGQSRLETADDLKRFANILATTRDGFAGVIAGMLRLHATLHRPKR